MGIIEMSVDGLLRKAKATIEEYAQKSIDGLVSMTIERMRKHPFVQKVERHFKMVLGLSILSFVFSFAALVMAIIALTRK
jgi:hypothetical protein